MADTPTIHPATDKPRRVLAFDFGTKRIGVAIGQELTCSATPLPPISANNGIPDWDRLTVLVEEWQPDAFVVGIPLNMDDSLGEMALRARKFGNRLHGRFHKPSYTMDERLSSFEAKAELRRSGGGTQQKTGTDSLSAKLILESWFRQQSFDNGEPL